MRWYASIVGAKSNYDLRPQWLWTPKKKKLPPFFQAHVVRHFKSSLGYKVSFVALPGNFLFAFSNLLLPLDQGHPELITSG
jgi:hypothetical protein